MTLYHVTLLPQAASFAADDESSLLMAAQQAGLRLPSSCRNGTCRTCMCRMACGEVSYRIAWPGLSPDEKHDGYILPCVAYPQSDVTLEARAWPMA